MHQSHLPRRQVGGDPMLELMFLCAIVAIVLIGLSVYSDFHDLWAHPHHLDDDSSRPARHGHSSLH